MPSPPKRPESSFLRTIHAPLLEDAYAEVQVAMQVAVLIERGEPRARIAELLDIPSTDVKAAVKRLERLKGRIERDPAPGQERD